MNTDKAGGRTVEQVISEQARRAARGLTVEQRRKNGRESWATRRRNLATKLGIVEVKV